MLCSASPILLHRHHRITPCGSASGRSSSSDGSSSSFTSSGKRSHPGAADSEGLEGRRKVPRIEDKTPLNLAAYTPDALAHLGGREGLEREWGAYTGYASQFTLMKIGDYTQLVALDQQMQRGALEHRILQEDAEATRTRETLKVTEAASTEKEKERLKQETEKTRITARTNRR